MKKISLLTVSLFSALVLNADMLPEDRGIGTRGTGLEEDERGIGTRGTGIGTRGTGGIGTRGTGGIGTRGTGGIGTRGTGGIGTRGTGGIGTRGTDTPDSSDSALNVLVNHRGALPYKNIFKNDALILKAILSKYLASQTLAFDNDPVLKNLAPLNFKEWAAHHAGDVLKSFEVTEWRLVRDSNIIGTSVQISSYQNEALIEVVSSPDGIDQNLQAGMITKALSEFFLYCGAPFSYDEIYFEVLPFEKDTVQSATTNFN